MLVRGLSNLRGGQFERYVYDGEFREADYLDDGEIRLFDSVKTRLADRHLAQVRNPDLWQVLAGNLPSDDGKASRDSTFCPYGDARNTLPSAMSSFACFR